MLVLHVSPPIVFPRERLSTALFRVGTAWNGTVVFPRLIVFVVDMPVQVRLGTESFVALRALMGSFVVTLVVTVIVSECTLLA